MLLQQAGLEFTSDYLAKLRIPKLVRPWIDVRTRYRFEKETTGRLSRVRGKVFLDIGAHMGYYSALLSRNFETVFAFEPDPGNYQMLINTILVGKLRNVKALRVAVSDHEGISRLYYDSHTYGHSLEKANRKDEGVLVRAATLDRLIQGGVDLVKIDVEGTEWKVITGAEQALRQGIIQRLLIEVHGERERGRFEKHLQDRNYETTWLDSLHLYASKFPRK